MITGSQSQIELGTQDDAAITLSVQVRKSEFVIHTLRRSPWLSVFFPNLPRLCKVMGRRGVSSLEEMYINACSLLNE